MTERQIQIAIARADIIICAALRWTLAVLPLAVVFALLILAARGLVREETHWIDYDAPGVDITSEGPEEGD